MPDIVDVAQRIVLLLPAMLLGVVCHEMAHGYVAYLLGDRTAKDSGRLTFNPVKHLDPMGSVVFLITAFWGQFVIGWAKPVPVNPRYFANPRKGMVLVSLAGPGANIALALLCALAMRVSMLLAGSEPDPFWDRLLIPLYDMAEAGVIINLVLAAFNLIPVPPLDGSKVVAGILPLNLAYRYLSIERWGILIVIILLAAGVLNKVLFPGILFAYRAVLHLAGVTM